MHITIARTTVSAALVLLLGLSSCSDSETRHLALLNQAKVVIDLGMPEDGESASASIIDRVLRLFAGDAVAQTVPARFSSVTVRITGMDFTPIQKTFTAYGELSFNVPAGNLRHFEVTAKVISGALSAARSFRGTATASLEAGATVNLPVMMRVYETKLVIPDQNANRLYIIDSIFDNTPRIINTALLTLKFQGAPPAWWLGPIAPFAVDFDARGRIYFSMTQGNPPFSNCIFRINTISGDGLTPIVADEIAPILGIAIDRRRHNLYFGRSNGLLYVINLVSNQAGEVPIPFALSEIRGITVDESANYLYLACSDGVNYGILKLKPGDAADHIWMPVPDGLPDDQAFDVMIKKPYVYVTLFNTVSPANNALLQFRLDDLAPTGISLTGPTTDPFFGPRHFIAKMNRGFMVMDQDTTNPDNNRIIGFLTMGGLGWYPYQPPGLLAPFVFY